jgi:hypothetical protein
VKILTTSIWLVTSFAGLVFLGSDTLRGAPQQGPSARPSAHSRRPKATKPTLHSGPASPPLETEFVPPAPPPAPPATSRILESYAERKKLVPANPQATPSSRSVRATKDTPAAAVEQASTANADQPDYSKSPDPEAQRIQDELQRLHDDSEARQAFYDDLRRTVQQVRAAVMSSDPSEEKMVSPEQNVRPSRPAETPLHQIGGHDAYSHPSSADPKPRESEIADPDNPQASLTPRVGGIDRAAYRMVARWAKANGTPVPLALGVAWMESHLNTKPARGAAGEVGMFQIMPMRCTLEGWPARRLSEPEFNAWMGTMLLARYYQEEGSVARAAAKYVAGPGVFDKKYSKAVWAYINWYAATVDSYASYFSHYQS